MLKFATAVASLMLAFNLAAQTNANPTVTVKVQDVSGKPVPEATVEYYTSQESDLNQKPKPKTAMTDSNGLAKFVATADWGEFVARKTGMSVAFEYCTTTRSEEPVLTLSEPCSISGVVVDENGKPVADAQVDVAMICLRPPLRKTERYASLPLFGDILSARTGSDGRFRIDGFGTNCAADLFVIKKGKAMVPPNRDHFAADTMMARAGEQNIQVKVEPGGSIEGTVIIPAIVKMSQVLVSVIKEGRPVQMQPGSDGRFRFEDLSTGEYSIGASFDTNKIPDWVADPVTVTVTAGKVTRDVTIIAVKGGVLELGVVSKSEHKPMKGVYVSARDENGSSENGITGEDGWERMRLVPGPYRVSANKEGSQTEQITVYIEEGRTNRVKLELIPPQRTVGTVRDTNGTPLAGVEVKNVLGSGPDSTVKTDANGHFEMKPAGGPGVGQGLTPFLLVRDRERNLAAACEIREGTESYDLRLAAGVIISGRVQNEQGKALTNAVVRGVAWGGQMGGWLDDAQPPKIDAEGRFEVRALPAGRRYNVQATAKGYGSDSSKIEDCDSNTELEPFVLRVADKQIAGIVVDSEGKPLKGVQVQIYGNGQPQSVVHTDAKGQFLVAEVCEGTVNISANFFSSSGGLPQYGSTRVQAGDTNVIVRVSRQGGNESSQPRRASLVGKPLPDLTTAGIPVDALQSNKPMLICLFDPEQRPSRRALRLLADQNESLKQKGLTVVGVSAALTTADALKEWKQSNPTPFAVGGVTEKNDKTQWILKTEKFPWLILTDAQGRVKAEGFELDELDAKLR